MMWVSGSWRSPQAPVPPHALKYRNATTLQPYAAAYHFRTCSNTSLLSPYEFMGSLVWSSGVGVALGTPYTAAVEENTKLRTPCCRSTSSIAMPADTLTSKKGPGLVTDSGISALAA